MAERDIRQARAAGAEVEDLPPQDEEDEAEAIAREHQRIAEHLAKHG